MKKNSGYLLIVIFSLALLSSCDKDSDGGNEEFELGTTTELLAFPLPEKIALNWISVPDAETKRPRGPFILPSIR